MVTSGTVTSNLTAVLLIRPNGQKVLADDHAITLS